MHPEPPSLKAQVRKLSFKDLAQNSADSRVVPSLSFPSRVASGVSLALPSRSSGGLVSGLQSPASDHEKHATGTPLSTRVISQPIAHGGVAAKKLSTAMSLVKKSAVDKGKKRGAKSGGGTRLGEYSIYVWGRGDEFRLGTGHQRDQHLPTIVVHACCAVKAVACGSMHTLMLFAMPHGEVMVLAWGEGQHGQLGFRPDSRMQKIMPGQIHGLSKLHVIEVGAGGNSSYALCADGKLYTWGDNEFQQLGLGASYKGVDKVFTPTQVSATWDTTNMQYRNVYFTKAEIHRKHGGGVDRNGMAYMWGSNSMGQLGCGDRVLKNTPTRVLRLLNATSLSLGLTHSAAIDSQHQLWTWGDLGEGRLGHGSQYREVKVIRDGIPSKERQKIDFLVEPKRVEFFRARHIGIHGVGCGDRFTIAVDRRGHVWTWGAGIYGQLGRGRAKLTCEFPERIAGYHHPEHQTQAPGFPGGKGKSPKAVPNTMFDMARALAGMRDAGGGSAGEDGEETLQPTSSAVSLDKFQDKSQEEIRKARVADRGVMRRVIGGVVKHGEEPAVESASEHSGGGEAHSAHAQEGQSHDSRENFVMVRARAMHAMAVTASGEVYTWGKGSHGLLGIGSVDNHYSPQLVDLQGKRVVTIGAGDCHCIAVVEELKESLSRENGYDMSPSVPNSEDLVCLVSADTSLSMHNQAACIPPPAPVPTPRAGARPLFDQVIGETDSGRLILESDDEEGVDIARIPGAFVSLSFNNIRKDIRREAKPIIQGADQFLDSEGWDLLDDPRTLAKCGLHPLLLDATPYDVKTAMGVKDNTIHILGLEAGASLDAADEGHVAAAAGSSSTPIAGIARAKTSTQPAILRAKSSVAGNGRTATSSGSKPVTPLYEMPLKEAMSVEEQRPHDEQHARIHAQNRANAMFAGLYKRMQNNGGKEVVEAHRPHHHSIPCSAVIGKVARGALEWPDIVPGPGAYTVPESNAFATVRNDIPRLAGLGLTLSAKERFIGEVDDARSTKGKVFDIFVKKLDPDGAAARALEHQLSTLDQGDRILKVDGTPVSDIPTARKLLQGVPGTDVRVLYQHKDKSGQGPISEVKITRRYTTVDKGGDPEEPANRAYHALGNGGAGAQSARFANEGDSLLSVEQEEEVLRIMQQVTDEQTPARLHPFKNRNAMVPAVVGIRSVEQELKRVHPEWDIKNAAVARVFKKHGFIQPSRAGAENPYVGPGSYKSQQWECHNWTEEGELRLKHTSFAHPSGAVSYREASDRTRTVAAKDLEFGLAVPYRHQFGAHLLVEEEDHTHDYWMRQAELYVFRRHLNANEYGRLGERKMEKLKKTAGNLKRLNGGEPGPWTYHPERFDLIGSKKEAMRPSSAGAHIRGIVIAGRYTSSAGDLIAPGPATYEIRGEGFNASGLYSHTRGSARIVPQCGPSKAEANSDHEVGFNAAISSFSAYGVEHRGTPFSSGGSGFTVQGRLAVEKDWSRTIGQVYNPDTANWEQGNPGPGEYTPRKPGVVAPTIAGRGSFEKDHLRESGMVRVRQEGKVDLLPRRKSETEGSKAEQGARRQSEVAEKLVLSGTGTQKPHKKPEDHFEWVPLVPGPNAYTPRVRNDGTALDASAAPSVSIVPRVVPLQGMEVPGPGAYDIPSIFSDRDHPSFREGPAWCLGERPPPAVANQGPGPGEYSANVYGAIGTDKVAIGAAMRAETGRSATEVVRAVRDKTYLYGEKLSEGHANIVRDEGGGKPALLNYSAMNKAVTAVKEGLQDRFSTVYDAFAYFDINGDWHVTPNEFATMLKKLQMGISDRDLTMLMHRLDAITDGTIDPKEFVSVLRWHPKPKSLSEMHQSMNQASQRRPMTLKAVQTRVFELTRMGKSMSFPDEVHQRQGKLLTPDHVPATQRPSEGPKTLDQRNDMRQGMTMSGKLHTVSKKSTAFSTPAPGAYDPRSAGDIGRFVAQVPASSGNTHLHYPGMGVQDSVTWAGSGNTTRGAIIGPPAVSPPRVASPTHSPYSRRYVNGQVSLPGSTRTLLAGTPSRPSTARPGGVATPRTARAHTSASRGGPVLDSRGGPVPGSLDSRSGPVRESRGGPDMSQHLPESPRGEPRRRGTAVALSIDLPRDVR